MNNSILGSTRNTDEYDSLLSMVELLEAVRG